MNYTKTCSTCEDVMVIENLDDCQILTGDALICCDCGRDLIII